MKKVRSYAKHAINLVVQAGALHTFPLSNYKMNVKVLERAPLENNEKGIQCGLPKYQMFCVEQT